MPRPNLGQHVLLFLLWAGFAAPLPVQLHKFQVWFTYQSQSNSLSTWFTMFTLCLAPLATHIVFGLPEPVILRSRGHPRPSWSDRLVHFNPVSILWRYYAIADHRFRATHWDALDMAACNAAFWDGQRWDGSEAMMVRSRELNTRQPEQAHIGIVSGSCLANIVVTLQGVQAIASFVATFMPPSSLESFTSSLPGIFQPLALLGLLRLQSAFWLSNDYGYNPLDTEYERLMRGGHPLLSSETSRLERTWGCRWWVFRFWWVASGLTLMGSGLLLSLDGLAFQLDRQYDIRILSSSEVAVSVTYSLLTGGCLMIHAFYLFKASRMSTIIPCNRALWYKLYTCLLMAGFLTCLILSALETKRFADGEYRARPMIICSDKMSDCQTVDMSISYNYTNSTR
jgi:hypothetical protein